MPQPAVPTPALPRRAPRRSAVAFTVLGLSAALVVSAFPASAGPVAAAAAPAGAAHVAAVSTTHQLLKLTGTTAVTTGPGIAAALLRAGIVPLPVAPARIRARTRGGLALTYGFPIRRGNPELAKGRGDILHRGGINFVGLKAHLRVTRFDIDLAAGKVFATHVNGKPARVALLDLDLSKLKVTKSHGRTRLSQITVRLDGAAAAALNKTFGAALPTDGSLVFGSAVVSIRG